jgi:hypothetical protein
LRIAFEDRDPKVFYFTEQNNLGQVKSEICGEFGINENEMKNFTLFRLDNFGEPAFPVKKEKNNFQKNNLCHGDFLLLVDNSKAPGADDQKFTLMINITITGLPDDCTYIGTIEISKDSKVTDLKD